MKQQTQKTPGFKNSRELLAHADGRRYGCTLRIYDNGGQTIDRYTMIPPRWTAADQKENGFWSCVFSGLDPRGMSGHGLAYAGPHLGQRIAWSELPEAVQALARSEWPEFCPPAQLAHNAETEQRIQTC